MDKVTGWLYGHTRPITVVGEIWNESPSGLTIEGRSTATIGLGVQEFVFLREDIVSVERDIEASA